VFDVYGYRNENIIYILYRRLFGWNSGNSIVQECVYCTHTHTHTYLGFKRTTIVVSEKSNSVPFQRRCSIPFCVFVSACVFAWYTDKIRYKDRPRNAHVSVFERVAPALRRSHPPHQLLHPSAFAITPVFDRVSIHIIYIYIYNKLRTFKFVIVRIHIYG